MYTTHLRPHIQSRQLGVCPVLAMNLLVEVKVDMEDAIVNGRVFFLLQVKKKHESNCYAMAHLYFTVTRVADVTSLSPKNCC